MSPLIAEFVGTALLVLLGNGAVANVLLARTKGKGADLIVIVWGWAMVVFVAVYVTASFSGAHLNPVVTVSLALAGKFAWSKVPGYVAAQMLGGMAGAFLVWLAYRQHFSKTDDPDVKLACFCTAPAIRSVPHNVVTEMICTFVLILGVLYLASPQVGLGALDALPVGLLVLGIGISLGGPTGYAMSPARDLAPRLMHALLPIPGKRGSDWRYAWIPVCGPLAGGAMASWVYMHMH
ncbi:glycerol uptake facilitator protein [Trinickia symbiotica]|uniref:Aquaporin family protein n=1 Tax=Trinickia symbiotica TaxID=863227 RepID=A0A2N7X3L4_9BURK|nr:MIP/aquaporin family protein [Trinickia symbiotica]PMS36336.1 aquaporin family protein [Trinickia symbiotica]PPK44854.1 glycerol uptake facilitator protein [Trinickia symbiotica]